MSWLAAVLIGHFLNAVSYVLDKVLLTKSIKNPFAFTFYIGSLGLLALVFIPWGFELPPAGALAVNLTAGALFSAALLFFFLALSSKEASRIVPFVGGAIPVVTWIFELLFLDERLNNYQFFAFVFLIGGTVLIAVEDKQKKKQKVAAPVAHKQASSSKTWFAATIAAIFFATSFGLTKIAFNAQPFFSAFIWMRVGGAIFPLFFLLWRGHRLAIAQALSIFKEKAGVVYLSAQLFGAAGFIFINYAISLTAVSIVNALQGVQYAFLLIMAVIGTIKYPNLLKESMGRRGLAIKIVATAIIGVGLYMIAQNSV